MTTRARGTAIAVAVLAAASAVKMLLWAGQTWEADQILAYRDTLRAAVEARPVLTLLVFTAVYVAIISSALPFGPPMSLMAGFLFGRWIGTAAILIAATAGAVVVFSLARASIQTRFGRWLLARAGAPGERLAADLRANAFGYLVIARLVPFFPFFLVNIAAGLAGLPVRTFALATLIGRLPSVFLYVSLGQEMGEVTSLADLAGPRIVLTLVGLAVLAIVPVVLTHHRATRPGAQAMAKAPEGS